MPAYRKGDLGKIILLVALILGAFYFSFSQFRSFKASSHEHEHSITIPAPQGGASSAVPVAKEMFAPRQRATSGIITQARTTPDPFRPYPSGAPSEQAQVRPTAQPPSAPPPARPLPPVTLPPAASGLADVRLIGIIGAGDQIRAVLRSGEERHLLRQGESLPEGWRVAQVEAQRVILVKGKQKITLSLSRAAEQRSASAPGSGR